MLFEGIKDCTHENFKKTRNLAVSKYEVLCPVAIGTEDEKRPFRGIEDRILNGFIQEEIIIRKVYNMAYEQTGQTTIKNLPEIEGIVQDNNDIITGENKTFEFINTHECPRYQLSVKNFKK